MHGHDSHATRSYWNHPGTKLTIGVQPNTCDVLDSAQLVKSMPISVTLIRFIFCGKSHYTVYEL